MLCWTFFVAFEATVRICTPDQCGDLCVYIAHEGFSVCVHTHIDKCFCIPPHTIHDQLNTHIQLFCSRTILSLAASSARACIRYQVIFIHTNRLSLPGYGLRDSLDVLVSLLDPWRCLSKAAIGLDRTCPEPFYMP